MLPDGAEDRLLANANTIAQACQKSGVQQWDLIGFQSYGHQLDIEAEKSPWLQVAVRAVLVSAWFTMVALDLLTLSTFLEQSEPLTKPWPSQRNHRPLTVLCCRVNNRQRGGWAV